MIITLFAPERREQCETEDLGRRNHGAMTMVPAGKPWREKRVLARVPFPVQNAGEPGRKTLAKTGF